MVLVWLGVVVAMRTNVEEPVKRSYARYSVRAEPPTDAGALQDRATCVLPGVAARDCGGVEVVFPTVTVIADDVATLLSASVVEAVRTCDAFDAPSVFQDVV